ncbi:cytidine deaminase family protein [Actinacidiphila alni]|uniref:cytidine deaminase family protein n=1 Tax=Actinacidiphila alni TaxID=380248 RepID=UPI0034568E03
MRIPGRELTPADHELIEHARVIVDANTDGEDGAHTMGAAVRGADGRMFGGINLYHFTGGPCAELVALGHARASGARELTTIVAVGNFGRGPVGPCGRDRQILFDYHPAIRVILPTPAGLRSIRIQDLMPLAAVWTLEEGTQPFDPALFTPEPPADPDA